MGELGIGYQHCVIVPVHIAGLFTCLVCQTEITQGNDVVLFDRGPDHDKVQAAHGYCISALARHLMTDADRHRAYTEYRESLIERYGDK